MSVLLAMIAVMTGAAVGEFGGVTLREREMSPPGQVISVSINGVVLKDSTQSSELSWDRVARVDGEFEQQAAEFGSFGERLWRARKRMERGDLVLAEPSLESLASEFAAVGGPTGILLHSARASCRLLRGAQVGALDPYSKFVACFSEEELRGVKSRQFKGLDSMPAKVKPVGILIPDFPPMWLDVPSLRLVIDFKVESGHAQTKALLAQYVTAAKFESGTLVELAGVDAGEDGDLVHDIVLARIGNKEQRAAARETLVKRIKPGIEEWRESWIRVGVGRSLIREDSNDEKLLGVAEMLHAPARFSLETPYLAGLALAESAVTLKAIADRGEADRLVMELREKYPRHPALEYRPIREWQMSRSSKVAAPVPTSPAPAVVPEPSKIGPGGAP